MRYKVKFSIGIKKMIYKVEAPDQYEAEYIVRNMIRKAYCMAVNAQGRFFEPVVDFLKDIFGMK